VNAKDASFSKLSVWIDSNADGVSQADELKTLDQLGITQLNLDSKQNASLNNGNIVGATSTFDTADGQTHDAADVWFQQGQSGGDLRGVVGGLVQAMANYGSDSGSTANAPKLDIIDGSKSTNVSAMAAAMSMFDANGQQLGGSTMTATSDETLRLKALQNS